MRVSATIQSVRVVFNSYKSISVRVRIFTDTFLAVTTFICTFLGKLNIGCGESDFVAKTHMPKLSALVVRTTHFTHFLGFTYWKNRF